MTGPDMTDPGVCTPIVEILARIISLYLVHTHQIEQWLLVALMCQVRSSQLGSQERFG
jgi:hypothetical protein